MGEATAPPTDRKRKVPEEQVKGTESHGQKKGKPTPGKGKFSSSVENAIESNIVDSVDSVKMGIDEGDAVVPATPSPALKSTKKSKSAVVTPAAAAASHPGTPAPPAFISPPLSLRLRSARKGR